MTNVLLSIKALNSDFTKIAYDDTIVEILNRLENWKGPIDTESTAIVFEKLKKGLQFQSLGSLDHKDSNRISGKYVVEFAILFSRMLQFAKFDNPKYLESYFKVLSSLNLQCFQINEDIKTNVCYLESVALVTKEVFSQTDINHGNFENLGVCAAHLLQSIAVCTGKIRHLDMKIYKFSLISKIINSLSCVLSKDAILSLIKSSFPIDKYEKIITYVAETLLLFSEYLTSTFISQALNDQISFKASFQDFIQLVMKIYRKSPFLQQYKLFDQVFRQIIICKKNPSHLDGYNHILVEEITDLLWEKTNSESSIDGITFQNHLILLKMYFVYVELLSVEAPLSSIPCTAPNTRIDERHRICRFLQTLISLLPQSQSHGPNPSPVENWRFLSLALHTQRNLHSDIRDNMKGFPNETKRFVQEYFMDEDNDLLQSVVMNGVLRELLPRFIISFVHSDLHNITQIQTIYHSNPDDEKALSSPAVSPEIGRVGAPEGLILPLWCGRIWKEMTSGCGGCPLSEEVLWSQVLNILIISYREIQTWLSSLATQENYQKTRGYVGGYVLSMCTITVNLLSRIPLRLMTTTTASTDSKEHSRTISSVVGTILKAMKSTVWTLFENNPLCSPPAIELFHSCSRMISAWTGQDPPIPSVATTSSTQDSNTPVIPIEPLIGLVSLLVSRGVASALCSSPIVLMISIIACLFRNQIYITDRNIISITIPKFISVMSQIISSLLLTNEEKAVVESNPDCDLAEFLHVYKDIIQSKIGSVSIPEEIICAISSSVTDVLIKKSYGARDSLKDYIWKNYEVFFHHLFGFDGAPDDSNKILLVVEMEHLYFLYKSNASDLSNDLLERLLHISQISDRDSNKAIEEQFSALSIRVNNNNHSSKVTKVRLGKATKQNSRLERTWVLPESIVTRNIVCLRASCIVAMQLLTKKQTNDPKHSECDKIRVGNEEEEVEVGGDVHSGRMGLVNIDSSDMKEVIRHVEEAMACIRKIVTYWEEIVERRSSLVISYSFMRDLINLNDVLALMGCLSLQAELFGIVTRIKALVTRDSTCVISFCQPPLSASTYEIQNRIILQFLNQGAYEYYLLDSERVYDSDDHDPVRHLIVVSSSYLKDLQSISPAESYTDTNREEYTKLLDEIRSVNVSDTIKAWCLILGSTVLFIKFSDVKNSILYARRGMSLAKLSLHEKYNNNPLNSQEDHKETIGFHGVIISLEGDLLLSNIYEHIGAPDVALGYISKAISLVSNITGTNSLLNIVYFHNLRLLKRLNSSRFHGISSALLQSLQNSISHDNSSKILLSLYEVLYIDAAVTEGIKKKDTDYPHFRFISSYYGAFHTLEMELSKSDSYMSCHDRMSLDKFLRRSLQNECPSQNRTNILKNVVLSAGLLVSHRSSLIQGDIETVWKHGSFDVQRSLRRIAAFLPQPLLTETNTELHGNSRNNIFQGTSSRHQRMLSFVRITSSCSLSLDLSHFTKSFDSRLAEKFSLILKMINRACTPDMESIMQVDDLLNKFCGDTPRTRVVSVLVYDNLSSRLLVGRYCAFLGPLVCAIPATQELYEIMEEWDKIMVDNKTLLRQASESVKLTETQKKEWWKSREISNMAIKGILERLEGFLGDWKYALTSTRTSNQILESTNVELILHIRSYLMVEMDSILPNNKQFGKKQNNSTKSKKNPKSVSQETTLSNKSDLIEDIVAWIRLFLRSWKERVNDGDSDPAASYRKSMALNSLLRCLYSSCSTPHLENGVDINMDECEAWIQRVAEGVMLRVREGVIIDTVDSNSTSQKTEILEDTNTNEEFDKQIAALASMKVVELRNSLKEVGLSTVGKKNDLCDRFAEYLQNRRRDDVSVGPGPVPSSQKSPDVPSSNCLKDDGDLILILGETLHQIPWENLPVLSSNRVTRIPSLSLLLSSLSDVSITSTQTMKTNDISEMKESSMSHGRCLNPERCWYLVDPEANLPNTQNTMMSFLQSYIGKWRWSGIVGMVPDIEKFRMGHSSSDLFIYCGHGAGEKLIELQTLREVQFPASLLWGCSSGKLTTHGVHDATGPILEYLIRGSPWVVGNLWDVTDKDIDRLSISCMRMLFGRNDEEKEDYDGANICESLLASRSDCKFRYLIGSAPVIYGLCIPISHEI